ncbi:hypothetical protein [Holzapfeliella sp. JNUCC 72]
MAEEKDLQQEQETTEESVQERFADEFYNKDRAIFDRPFTYNVEEEVDYPEYSDKDKSFVLFYIDRLKNDNLELLTYYDRPHHLTMDLNRFIIQNINVPDYELMRKCLFNQGDRFKMLINDIAEQGNEEVHNFETLSDWNNWYHEERGSVHDSIS